MRSKLDEVNRLIKRFRSDKAVICEYLDVSRGVLDAILSGEKESDSLLDKTLMGMAERKY